MNRTSTLSSRSHDIAQAALAAARKSRPARPKFVSRTADKFVVRASGQLLAAMAELGKHQLRSANSEVTFALSESLAGRVRARTERKCYETTLGPDLAAAVLKQVVPYDETEVIGRSKSIVRLPDGIRLAIADCVDRKNPTEPKFRSMNAWVLDALVWWINHQRKTYALLNACIAMNTEGELA